MAAPKTITLGSGDLFLMEYDGTTLPEVDTICVEDNRLGYIKGGATVTYTPEYYEAKDDLGYVVKTILTSEEATFKSGILTFDGNTLKTLSDTGRVTEDGTKRTVLIGGAGNSTNQNYIICFHHTDKTDGDKWVLVVGRNQAGFSLAFAKDSETVIDAEFKCFPQDDAGTLIKYIEEIKTTTEAEG